MNQSFSECFQTGDRFLAADMVRLGHKQKRQEEAEMAKERLYRMTEPQKNMLVIALLEERHRQQARGVKSPPVGDLAVRADEAPLHNKLWPWEKEALYDLYLNDAEWQMARDAINALRNQRLAQGKGNGGTDRALLKLMEAKYKNVPDRE